MRYTATLALAGLAALTLSASAQAAPDNDVRCFLLSNAFGKKATDPKARAAAAASMTFYLGRLDARGNPAGVADSVRREGPTIDLKTAGAQMGACATRMERSGQTIQAAIRAHLPAK